MSHVGECQHVPCTCGNAPDRGVLDLDPNEVVEVKAGYIQALVQVIKGLQEKTVDDKTDLGALGVANTRVLDLRERQLVPCDCKKPLVGFIPNKGPRCRLCNRQFTVVEETKGMRTNARARAALDLMQAARAAEEDGNTEAAKRLRGEARGLWS